jgi:hypothetical protein
MILSLEEIFQVSSGRDLCRTLLMDCKSDDHLLVSQLSMWHIVQGELVEVEGEPLPARHT